MQKKYSHFFMNIGTCEFFKDAVSALNLKHRVRTEFSKLSTFNWLEKQSMYSIKSVL